MKQGTNKKSGIGSIVLVIIACIALMGFLAYLSNNKGLTSNKFYIECDGRMVEDLASDFEVSNNIPLVVSVHQPKNSEKGYTVKVIPNAIKGTAFDFYLNGEPYSFHHEKDLTEGFVIEMGEDGFSIKSKGTINDILSAIYPEYELSDCRGHIYDNMFALIVTANDGQSIRMNFSVNAPIAGIILNPEVIIFWLPKVKDFTVF